MKKYLPIASISLLAATLVVLVFYPSASSILGITSLLLSLALSIYTIYQTHKRIGSTDSHSRRHPLPRWDCCHVGKLPSEHKVGRGGGTSVRDRGEFSCWVSGPHGDDEVE